MNQKKKGQTTYLSRAGTKRKKHYFPQKVYEIFCLHMYRTKPIFRNKKLFTLKLLPWFFHPNISVIENPLFNTQLYTLCFSSSSMQKYWDDKDDPFMFKVTLKWSLNYILSNLGRLSVAKISTFSFPQIFNKLCPLDLTKTMEKKKLIRKTREVLSNKKKYCSTKNCTKHYK